MLDEKINIFFSDYEARFNKALNGEELDISGIQNSFAKHYIEANPGGINCGSNDFLFRLSIPKGYRFYKKLGMRSIRISEKQIIPLDTYHYMVRVNWNAWYIKKNEISESIDFTVIYFLQHLNNELKIFSYITGEEQKLLLEKGLLEE
jgi:hypothetical protein